MKDAVTIYHDIDAHELQVVVENRRFVVIPDDGNNAWRVAGKILGDYLDELNGEEINYVVVRPAPGSLNICR